MTKGAEVEMTSNGVVTVQAHVTYEAAAEALQAGLRKAEELGIRVGICIVDANGASVVVARMTGATARVEEGARGKATAAAGLGVSTKEFIEKRLQHNEALWRAMSSKPTTFMVEGGFPLRYQGKSVGGVGVSGAKHEEDSQVSEAVAEAFAKLAEREEAATGV